jgi:myosin heavy subunit
VQVKNSMDLLQFPPHIKAYVFNIVAGVLHFGNLIFQKKSEDDDVAEIKNREVLEIAAHLWNVDVGNIEKFLCGRNMQARGVTYITYNVSQGMIRYEIEIETSCHFGT